MAENNKLDFKPLDFQPEEDTSVGIGDIVRPTMQGFTLGTSDEIMGAAKAAKKALGGDVPLTFEALKDAYIHHRNQERAANELSEKHHPLLYKGLELAGGLAAPIPGLGELKGLSTAAKIGKTIAHGAKVGAAAGVGYSEGENPQELAQPSDIAQGAAIGATAGALPGAVLGGAAGAAKLGGYIPKLPFLPNIGQLSKGAAEGIAGHTPSNTNLLGDVENLLEKIGSRKDATKAAYERLLKGAEAEGQRIPTEDLNNMVKQLQREYSSNRTPEVQNDIAKVVKTIRAYTEEPKTVKVPIERAPLKPQVEGLTDSAGNPVQAPSAGPSEMTQQVVGNRPLPPREAQNLKSSLGEMAKYKKLSPDLESKEGRKFANEVKQHLSQELSEAMPGIADTDKSYSLLEGALKNLGIKPENLYTKNPGTGKLEISPQAIGKVQSLLKNASKDKASADVAQRQLGLLGSGLEALGEKANTGELLQKAKTSNIFDTTAGKFGSYVGYGAQKTAEAEPTTKTLAQAPEQLGLYKKAPHNSYELSKDVKGASRNDMIDFAESAKAIPGLEQQSKRLEQAVDMGDLKTMNQVMFDLLQRPSFRKSLEKPASTTERNKSTGDIVKQSKNTYQY